MVNTRFPVTFFKLSEDFDPFHAEKYCVQRGHSVNNINDESLCNNCFKRCTSEKSGWSVRFVVSGITKTVFMFKFKR